MAVRAENKKRFTNVWDTFGWASNGICAIDRNYFSFFLFCRRYCYKERTHTTLSGHKDELHRIHNEIWNEKNTETLIKLKIVGNCIFEMIRNERQIVIWSNYSECANNNEILSSISDERPPTTDDHVHPISDDHRSFLLSTACPMSIHLHHIGITIYALHSMRRRHTNTHEIAVNLKWERKK